MGDRIYPGKIILFGEYTIILGGKVLALPLNNISAHWQQNVVKKKDSDLLKYAKHLNKENKTIIKFKAFLEDVQDGWSLKSDIPQGYGAGSSGSLVAAVFDRFQNDNTKYTIEELKIVFSDLESFFHGTSSGIDPLVSYFNRPLHIDKDKKIEMVEKDLSTDLRSFSLVDSGISKVTEKYVRIFKNSLQDVTYVKNLEKLEMMNTEVIDGLITKISSDELSQQMQKISLLQWELFQPMIPTSVADMWKTGLDTDQYYMKLCGSGGGGYFLVYSVEKSSRAKDWLPLKI